MFNCHWMQEEKRWSPDSGLLYLMNLMWTHNTRQQHQQLQKYNKDFLTTRLLHVLTHGILMWFKYIITSIPVQYVKNPIFLCMHFWPFLGWWTTVGMLVCKTINESLLCVCVCMYIVSFLVFVVHFIVKYILYNFYTIFYQIYFIYTVRLKFINLYLIVVPSCFLFKHVKITELQIWTAFCDGQRLLF